MLGNKSLSVYFAKQRQNEEGGRFGPKAECEAWHPKDLLIQGPPFPHL